MSAETYLIDSEVMGAPGWRLETRGYVCGLCGEQHRIFVSTFGAECLPIEHWRAQEYCDDWFNIEKPGAGWVRSDWTAKKFALGELFEYQKNPRFKLDDCPDYYSALADGIGPRDAVILNRVAPYVVDPSAALYRAAKQIRDDGLNETTLHTLNRIVTTIENSKSIDPFWRSENLYELNRAEYAALNHVADAGTRGTK